MNYSGIFRRFVAYTVDLIVMFGIYLLGGLVLGLNFLFIPLSALPMIGLWFYGGIFLVAYLYFALMESSRWQATIGKQLLRIRVTTLTGERISFVRASVRFLSKFLSRFIFMIGFLMIPFTKKKQALHDKIARTLVIRERAPQPEAV